MSACFDLEVQLRPFTEDGNIEGAKFIIRCLKQFGHGVLELAFRNYLITLMYLYMDGEPKRTSLKIVKMFLDAGVDINGAMTCVGIKYTCLMYAAEYKHTELFRLLLVYGADPFYMDGFGRTARHIAERANVTTAKARMLHLLDKYEKKILNKWEVARENKRTLT